MKFIKPEKIRLKNHSELNEKWVQEIIADDPGILGLGDLVLKDKERIQPKAGRLDLLLQDVESNRRYEVELQLGQTDESHIIRTVEYWDIERKRFPQYDHCAVIVAEDITARFLNVISLFNGHIPLIAIQMNALKYEEGVSLVFTTVLDELTLGFEEDDEEAEPTDRNYWETKRGTKETVAIADHILEGIQEFAPGHELKYNKFYIGLAKNGSAHNFVRFRPQKKYLLLLVRLSQSDEIQQILDESDLEILSYSNRWREYRIRLTQNDVSTNMEILNNIMKKAYENFGS